MARACRVVAVVVAFLVPGLGPGAATATTEGGWRPGLTSVSQVAPLPRAGLPAAGASAPAAGYEGYRAACHGTDHLDSDDAAELDISTYGPSLDCDRGIWTVSLGTFDAWPDSRLGAALFVFDTDGAPSTGCGGFEWAAQATYDAAAGGFRAGLLSTPSCDSATWSLAGPAGVQRAGSADVSLQFEHAKVGAPSELRWYTQLAPAGLATADDAPDSGFHTEAGIPPAATSECRVASAGNGTSRYYTVGDGPRAAGQLAGVLAAAGLSEVRHLGSGVVSFGGDPGAARAALAGAGLPSAVHLDRPGRYHAVPNDPGFPSQWELSAVQAGPAWDLTRGSPGIVVAVLDSGVDAGHPELAGKLTGGWDATTGQPLPAGNSDPEGHGTATTGLVGALTDNATGVASLGWDGMVMPVKIGDATGPFDSATVAGLRHAADSGARIANLSFGLCDSAPLTEAVAYAQSKGMLVVAAVGNEALQGNPISFPAAYPGVLGVGAIGFDRTRAFYSTANETVDLAAPGGSGDGDPAHDVLVIVPGGGLAKAFGTSFSAPMVSAAAALVLAAAPSLTPAQAGDRLLQTAVDAGTTGRDTSYGFGVLDAAAAVRGGTFDVVSRVAGADRLATAIAISRAGFPDGGAASAVLTRHDDYPDALAGTPLAVARGGPLLLTPRTGLDPAVEAELRRVLPAGNTVHLLGGESALSAGVESRVRELGYTPVRYPGADRFETAARIAEQGLGSPSTVLLATGLNFPDALAGGAAAAKVGGAVLLTADSRMPTLTSSYLAAHPPTRRYALGGPAAQADPGATPIAGEDRYDTARRVASTFFSAPASVGVASGANFPDALGGGAHAGKLGVALLLSRPDVLPAIVRDHLSANRSSLSSAYLYGGPSALSDQVLAEVRSVIS